MSATEVTATPRIEQRVLAKKLGLGAICGIIFFSVSGGPYGLEETIGEAGAGAGLLLILITPLIWSLPTALMVAEMGTTMPVQGGYYHWSKTNLGPFWGFQTAWWMWVVSWVDMAIYPVLFVSYLSAFPYFDRLVGEGGNGWVRYLIAFAVVWVFGLMNIRGSKLVGDSSRFFLVLVIAPFVLLSAIGLFQMDRNPLEPFTFEGTSLAPALGAGLFVVMWNYMGWDALSTVAGEIDRPQTNFPKALAITIPLITIVYLLPTVVSLANSDPRDVEWTDGTYVVIAKQIAGSWLGWFVAGGALIFAVGLYSAWMLSNSRLPFILADDGYLPSWIAKLHPRSGSPYISIIICCAICSIFINGSFAELVAIDVTIYGMALLTEFAAFVAMRIRHPDLERPYRVPGGWFGVGLVCLFPTLVVIAAVYYQVLDVGFVKGVIWALIGAATGPVAYLLLRGRKQRLGIDRSYTIDMIRRGEFELEGTS